MYWESWRLCCSFINLTKWRQRRVTCLQLIGYINTREKISFFHVCCYGFSQGQKTLYNTAVYVINRGYYMASLVNREGFAVHSSNWPSGAKGVWRVSSWLSISTHVKKYLFFTCVVTAFLKARKPYITPQFMW